MVAGWVGDSDPFFSNWKFVGQFSRHQYGYSHISPTSLLSKQASKQKKIIIIIIYFFRNQIHLPRPRRYVYGWFIWTKAYFDFLFSFFVGRPRLHPKTPRRRSSMMVPHGQSSQRTGQSTASSRAWGLSSHPSHLYPSSLIYMWVSLKSLRHRLSLK